MRYIEDLLRLDAALNCGVSLKRLIEILGPCLQRDNDGRVVGLPYLDALTRRFAIENVVAIVTALGLQRLNGENHYEGFWYESVAEESWLKCRDKVQPLLVQLAKKWPELTFRSYGLITTRLGEDGAKEMLSAAADGITQINNDAVLCILLAHAEPGLLAKIALRMVREDGRHSPEELILMGAALSYWDLGEDGVNQLLRQFTPWCDESSREKVFVGAAWASQNLAGCGVNSPGLDRLWGVLERR